MGYEAVARKWAQGKAVVLDGAVGSEVVHRTKQWIRNGIESSPEVIRTIHREYINAGADVITTNTFQIARHTFVNFFHGIGQMRVIGRPGLERCTTSEPTAPSRPPDTLTSPKNVTIYLPGYLIHFRATASCPIFRSPLLRFGGLLL